MDFTDKQSYLEWIAAWKAEEKQLASEQRQLRQELSKAENHISRPTQTSWGIMHLIPASDMMYKKLRNRCRLSLMYETRRSAKKISWEMKQKSKE